MAVPLSQRMQRGILGAMGLLVPLAFDPRFRDLDRWTFDHPKQLLAFAGAGLFLILAFASRSPEEFRSPLVGPVVLGGVALGLNGALHGFGTGHLFGVLCLAMLIALPPFFQDARDINVAMYSMLLAGAISAFYALFQYFGIDPLFFAQRDPFTRQWVPHGFSGSSAMFAALAGAVLPWCLYVIFHSRFGVIKITAVVGFVLMTVGIIATRTRTTLVVVGMALVCAVGALAWRNWPWVRQRLPLIAGAAVGMVLIFFPLLRRNPVIPQTVANPERIIGRTESHWRFWQVSGPLTLASPLGGRLNAFPSRYMAQAEASPTEGSIVPLYRDIHNELFELFSSLGILGALSLFWGLAATSKRLDQRLRQGLRSQEKTLCACCIASLMVLLLQALFTFPLHHPPLFLLGLAVVAIPAGPWRLRPYPSAHG